MMSKTIEKFQHGDADPDFDTVRQAFIENFTSRGEVGAAVCVYKHGNKVVDLWGGYRDAEKLRPWEQDSIVCMMSVGKGIAALAVHMLIDRGVLDLDKAVAHYWPAFAQADKAEITVKMLMGGLAGLIYAEHAADGSLLNWDVMVAALERQTPVCTRGAYHSMTAGFLFGELLKKVDGRDIARFVKEEISDPLQVDFKFGISEKDLTRTAEVIPNKESDTINAIADPNSNLGKAWRVVPKTPDFFFNTREFLQAVLPSANGVGNARAVARIYAALAQGGAIDGVRLLSSTTIESMRETQWQGLCGLTERPFRYGLGFFLNYPPLIPFGPNPDAFGHPGAGGAIGFADPEAGLALSYSPNFMCSGAGVGDRCEALINALYQ